MQNNVSCIGISEDCQTLTQLFSKTKSDTSRLSNEASDILENLQNLLINNNDRKNIETDSGIWCCTKSSNITYIGLVNRNYPDRLSFQMLKELEKIYLNFNNNQDLDLLKKKGNELVLKFNSPEKFDKLSQAQNDVNGLQRDMQKNVDKLVDNQEDLEDLENQTKNLQDNAGKFSKKSKSLERVMLWKNIKFWIFLVCFVVILIIIIVLIAKYA